MRGRQWQRGFRNASFRNRVYLRLRFHLMSLLRRVLRLAVFFISFQQSIASPYWTNVLYIIWNCAWLSIDNDSHFMYSSIHGLKALYLTTNWWGVASDREDFEALHFLKSGFISAFAFTWCPWYGKPVQAVCRFFSLRFFNSSPLLKPRLPYYFLV